MNQSKSPMLSPQKIKTGSESLNSTPKDKPLRNLRDLNELIFKTLTSKFFSGVNMITGRSNLRTLVESSAEISIAIRLLIFLLQSNPLLAELPLEFVGWVYFIKYLYISLDSLSLIWNNVLSIFDVFNNLIDALFWFSFQYTLGSNHESISNFLRYFAIARFIWSGFFWIGSCFVFGRDDPVRAI